MPNFAFASIAPDSAGAGFANFTTDGLDYGLATPLALRVSVLICYGGDDIPDTHIDRVILDRRVEPTASPNEIGRLLVEKIIDYAFTTWGATVPSRNVTIFSLQNG